MKDLLKEIVPIHQDGADCFEEILYMYLNWRYADYELMFSESLEFAYQYNLLLGESIIGSDKNNITFINKYWGQLIYHDSVDSTETFDFIRAELLRDHPVFVIIDTFYCIRLNDYQKVHREHYCLVVKIDSENNFYCYDNLNSEVLKICLKEFIEGIKGYFEIKESLTKEKVDYLQIFNDSIAKLCSKNIGKQVQMFADDFYNRFDYHLEFKNFEFDIYAVPLHRNIGHVIAGRECYIKFLRLYVDKSEGEELVQAIDLLKDSVIKWQMIRNILVKSYYKGFGNPSKEKIFNLLKEISKLEESSVELLYSIKDKNIVFLGNKNKSEKHNHAEVNFESAVILDLTEYFSNNAFGATVSKDCTADFTGTGFYFLAENIPHDKLVCENGISYMFPKIQDNINDNISCNSQEIAVPIDEYKGISFLGCAEYGNYAENMKIVSSNEIYYCNLKFSDWAFAPTFGETIAWRGYAVEKRKDTATLIKGSLKNILNQTCFFENTHEIKSIILPECPNIHIFSITLLK